MKHDFYLMLFNLNYLVAPLIVFVMITKIALFFTFKTSKCKYADLVYFNYNQILSSKSSENAEIKIIQNSLTFYFVFLVVFEFFLLNCSPK